MPIWSSSIPDQTMHDGSRPDQKWYNPCLAAPPADVSPTVVNRVGKQVEEPLRGCKTLTESQYSKANRWRRCSSSSSSSSSSPSHRIVGRIPPQDPPQSSGSFLWIRLGIYPVESA
ncbi:hypothetical protein Tco_1273172 [Tanacetum coccineum]